MTSSRRRPAAVTCILLAAALTGCAPPPATGTAASPTASSRASTDARAESAARALQDLEKQYDSTLGVYALDTGTGRELGFRADERFAYASTSKALLAGAVLAHATAADLGRTLTFFADDLVAHSPVLERHVGDGLPLREVIEAAVRASDNTAANLLFRELGGPSALEEDLRAMGDVTTQVDRVEPDLNEAAPGDDRDTSTPRALARTLRAYALGGALSPENREFLIDAMSGNATGDALIRAGMPPAWEVADKSGAAAYGTRNDIAIVRRPGRAPLVMAVLSCRASPDAPSDDRLIADAAREIAKAFT